MKEKEIKSQYKALAKKVSKSNDKKFIKDIKKINLRVNKLLKKARSKDVNDIQIDEALTMIYSENFVVSNLIDYVLRLENENVINLILLNSIKENLTIVNIKFDILEEILSA